MECVVLESGIPGEGTPPTLVSRVVYARACLTLDTGTRVDLSSRE